MIWTGEFGQAPDSNNRGGVNSLGGGHNNRTMTVRFAVGGVKFGVVGSDRRNGFIGSGMQLFNS
jgi:hypothetical protein